MRRMSIFKGTSPDSPKAAKLAGVPLLRKPTPCAPVVAFVGPDGAGKSSLIANIAKSNPPPFTKVVPRRWAPGFLPPLWLLAGKAKQKPNAEGLYPPRRKPGRFYWFRLLYRFTDFLLGYYMKDHADANRRCLVLYDRHFLDILVDPVRFGLSSNKGAKFLYRFVPKPDLIILLKDTPERIYARKPELPRDEIEQQLNKWKTLLDEGLVHAVIETDAPPEEIAKRAITLITDTYSQMHRRAHDTSTT